MKAAIKHEGFHTRRLSPEADNPREVAFAEQWKQENDDNQLLLRLLLGPEENPLSPFGGKRERFAEVTQENASVAATIAQWLGSNIGMSFLDLALSRCGYKVVPIGKGADR